MRQESAIEWLSRVRRDSPYPRARMMAEFALSEWSHLTRSWKRRRVKTRRSLWDLIAGVFECHQNIEHHALMTPVTSESETFYFPIFEEAVVRRAKHPPSAKGSISAGVSIRSGRLPQTGKWGNTICKT